MKYAVGNWWSQHCTVTQFEIDYEIKIMNCHCQAFSRHIQHGLVMGTEDGGFDLSNYKLEIISAYSLLVVG